MKNILKILKVNILSLIALPLLLLATTSKLIAKALEKIALMLGMSLFTVALILLFEAIKAPCSAFQLVLIIVACMIIFFLVVLAIQFLLAIAVVIWQYSILIFEAIYGFTYAIYIKLNEICENDFKLLSLQGEQKKYMIICPFYSLLRGTNWLITGFISLSLYLALIACGILVICSIIHMNNYTQEMFGLNLISYIGKFDTFSIVNGVVVYLAIIATFCGVLLSLGIEWQEWSKELKMSPAEYAEYVSKLQESELQLEASEEENEYLKHLSKHIDCIEALEQDVEAALTANDNPVLRSTWSRYLHMLTDITDTFSSYNGKIPLTVFKKMIPQIQKLDKQLEEIQKMVEKAKEDAQNPAKSSVFFSGCNTAEKLDKRYKSLCKAYHPDSPTGDEETFKELQAEYEKMKSLLS